MEGMKASVVGNSVSWNTVPARVKMHLNIFCMARLSIFLLSGLLSLLPLRSLLRWNGALRVSLVNVLALYV